jgi:hypothetical protein
MKPPPNRASTGYQKGVRVASAGGILAETRRARIELPAWGLAGISGRANSLIRGQTDAALGKQPRHLNGSAYSCLMVRA